MKKSLRLKILGTIGVVFVLLVGVGFALSGNVKWMNDFSAAKERAQAENKPILINFTGSDWCGWCIKTEKEVFSQKAFKDFAKDHLVLMEVDFPENKPQSDELKEQNQRLDKEFKIEGYPTIFLLDAEGNKLTEDIGYLEGGAEAYVATLKKHLNK